jgi:hypothetical protein
VRGTIWSVPTHGGTPTAWSTAPKPAPAGFLGAHGLTVHDGVVWATNLDKGTILRIPILGNGRADHIQTGPSVCPASTTSPSAGAATNCSPPPTGPAKSRSSSPTAATPPCRPQPTVCRTNPTSIALHGHTVYVLNAGWLTGKDPNLIHAHQAT